MTPDERLATVLKLLERYNAQDADGYVELMTDGASEANWRGAVVRDGKEGVRAGLKAMFAEFPENRVEVMQSFVMGEKVVLHEKVFRSSTATPFDVMVIYGFDGPLVDRVEFVR